MKPKLTTELADEALKLIKGGATNADVIAWLGVCESSFYEWIKNPKTPAQTKLAEGIKKAETERKLWHLQRIHAAAENGNWQASAWYLERRYPKEYGKKLNVDAKQSQKVTVNGVTEEEAMKDLTELAARMVKSHE